MFWEDQYKILKEQINKDELQYINEKLKDTFNLQLNILDEKYPNAFTLDNSIHYIHKQSNMEYTYDFTTEIWTRKEIPIKQNIYSFIKQLIFW